MVDGEALIDRFYAAFAVRDPAGMIACYAPDVHFHDPVFQDLRGPEVGGMWTMLAGRAKDLTVELAERSATDVGGTARWIAHYTFAQTGRPVRNDVRATFRFGADGLIAEHRDEFDLWAWTRQALGPVGVVAGWTPIVQSGVRRKARAGLDAHLAATATGATP